MEILQKKIRKINLVNNDVYRFSIFPSCDHTYGKCYIHLYLSRKDNSKKVLLSDRMGFLFVSSFLFLHSNHKKAINFKYLFEKIAPQRRYKKEKIFRGSFVFENIKSDDNQFKQLEFQKSVKTRINQLVLEVKRE